MQAELTTLIDRVRTAHATRAPLAIQGSSSKAFLGEAVSGEALDVTRYRGIVEYEPNELVLTLRAGTPLAEVQQVLDGGGQMLAFEPPHFGASATIGGCVATGLSGPRRPYAGSVRDFVLGMRIIDGQGNDLHFGGKVIKNVAGYDVSRLMVGAYGTLGVITEISFKVLPKPAGEVTLWFECDAASAIDRMNRWAAQPLPISASFYDGVRLYLRLSGAATAVASARKQLGGALDDDQNCWSAVREQTLPFFQSSLPLWRLSLPSTTAPLSLPGAQLVEWGGALRWLSSDADAASIRAAVESVGGSAMVFRRRDQVVPAFHPLGAQQLQLNLGLKRTFDPANVLNPGRMGIGQ